MTNQACWGVIVGTSARKGHFQPFDGKTPTGEQGSEIDHAEPLRLLAATLETMLKLNSLRKNGD